MILVVSDICEIISLSSHIVVPVEQNYSKTEQTTKKRADSAEDSMIEDLKNDETNDTLNEAKQLPIESSKTK
jgi:hypothetical protein